ncbi:hypothetical protein C8Q80DRAFT_1125293 [Daedaleopsis nitida]|nr:hypothetical protein C8Q80DRAFT_1125293 [Daedaleopsis nitida]
MMTPQSIDKLIRLAKSPGVHAAMWTLFEWVDIVQLKKSRRFQLNKVEQHLIDKWESFRWPTWYTVDRELYEGQDTPTLSIEQHPPPDAPVDEWYRYYSKFTDLQCRGIRREDDSKPDPKVLNGFVLALRFAGIADVGQLGERTSVLDVIAKVSVEAGKSYRKLLSQYVKKPANVFIVRSYTGVVPPTEERIVTLLSGCAGTLMEPKPAQQPWNWMSNKLVVPVLLMQISLIHELQYELATMDVEANSTDSSGILHVV